MICLAVGVLSPQVYFLDEVPVTSCIFDAVASHPGHNEVFPLDTYIAYTSQIFEKFNRESVAHALDE